MARMLGMPAGEHREPIPFRTKLEGEDDAFNQMLIHNSIMTRLDGPGVKPH